MAGQRPYTDIKRTKTRTMIDAADADFDVNIFDDSAFDKPNILLTFPLPTDRETYVDLDHNEKIAKNFGIVHNFFRFFTGYNFEEIYLNNEYRYSINKYTPEFTRKLDDYMDDQLENKDTKLNELVYDLCNLELKLNLTMAKDFPNRFKEVKQFMVKYYQIENSKNTPIFSSPNFVRISYMTVMTCVRKIFPQGLWVSRAEFSKMYKQYLDDPMSIVFLPNHQSHMDYIVIHLLLVRFQMSLPAVIAGENLNVAVFGKMLRNMGAIFIKRTFNNELYTERNLSNLIEFLLLNKIHLEVFIEGTRSRDGKLLVPKYGVLKYLSSIYLNQRREQNNINFNMLLQPISITYERIYEADGFLDELIGRDKKQESTLNILSNGISSLFGGSSKNDMSKFPQTEKERNGIYDSTDKSLHGKIYVKFGNAFKLSSFIEKEKNEVLEDKITVDIDSNKEDVQVNLKMLGFKILHEINRVSYLPPISIIGAAVQAYHYYFNKSEIPVKKLVPFLRVILKELDFVNPNMVILSAMSKASDAELVALIKSQVPQFFRFVKVNNNKDVIIIEKEIELLYYKNLSIHLFIHKCLTCFIIYQLNQMDRSFSTENHIRAIFYIFTGFLKNEFLFDYDYNTSHELSNILKELETTDKIKRVNSHFEILDQVYVSVFAEVIKPFVESYMLCINNINSLDTQVKAKQQRLTEQQLINDDLISKDYPTTKTLLKRILQSKSDQRHIEATNKQYLLSCLFYLYNLRLIKIFKNKSRTKAYVLIQNARDLQFTLKFMNSFINLDRNFLCDESISYMTDIIDKNFDRSLNEAKL